VVHLDCIRTKAFPFSGEEKNVPSRETHTFSVFGMETTGSSSNIMRFHEYEFSGVTSDEFRQTVHSPGPGVSVQHYQSEFKELISVPSPHRIASRLRPSSRMCHIPQLVTTSHVSNANLVRGHVHLPFFLYNLCFEPFRHFAR
jgi:hypothetical protein